MALLKVCLTLVICLALAQGAVRVARSPQFGGGGFSQAGAQAQAGGFGPPSPPGIFPGPRPIGGGPGFGRPGFGGPGFGGSGFGGSGFARPGTSISISKSISIGSGGGGGAQSSSSSNAFGK